MKISIITVAFNSASTIANTIESVLNQTYTDLEYLIIDGDSKDTTVQIAESYISRFEAKNIAFRIISEPDKGMYDAMNKGIQNETGTVIGILNSDDTYASNTVLQTVADTMQKKEIDSCYGNLVYVKGTKPYRFWKSGKPRTFKYGWMPPHPAFFVKKNIYENSGLFRLDCGTVADYEMMLRLLEKEHISSCWINQVFTYMQVGGASNAGMTARINAHNNDIKAWNVNQLNCSLLTPYLKKIRKISQFITVKLYKYKG